MKKKTKAAIAVSSLCILILLGVYVGILTEKADAELYSPIYPNENTMIRLYGESHGDCFDEELELWKECYADGCRCLFYELPYYSAEFLNIWMKEDSDILLDQLLEDIASSNAGSYAQEFKAYLWEIKKSCPETVFYGTDVGHAYQTNGERYLRFLEEKGLKESESYLLAEECIRQGKEFYAEEGKNPTSVIRENYMTANFVDAYQRCGEGKIMGIYGVYHTAPDNPKVMAGKLHARYGDVMSSVDISKKPPDPSPYRLGPSISGALFFLLLFVPEIIRMRKKKPDGLSEAGKTDKVLRALEHAGAVGVGISLLIFRVFDPIWSENGNVFMSSWFVLFILALAVAIIYDCFLIRFFKGEGTVRNFYGSAAGFPAAGAALPVIAVLLLGIYSQNLIEVGAAAIFGVGRIGTYALHKND